jgi:hypothetical protein
MYMYLRQEIILYCQCQICKNNSSRDCNTRFLRYFLSRLAKSTVCQNRNLWWFWSCETHPILTEVFHFKEVSPNLGGYIKSIAWLLADLSDSHTTNRIRKKALSANIDSHLHSVSPKKTISEPPHQQINRIRRCTNYSIPRRRDGGGTQRGLGAGFGVIIAS